MKIHGVRAGSARLYIHRMNWNLRTQKRYLKNDDAPPDDCEGWTVYSMHYVGRTSHYRTISDRQIVHDIIEVLISRVEREPNRWWKVTLLGDSGYATSTGWVSDKVIDPYYKSVTVLGPYCKDKGVLPEFEKDEDGFYVLPFNMPEGVFTTIDYDESKPDFGDEQPKVVLEAEPIPAGTEIVVLDEWGLEASKTEVI